MTKQEFARLNLYFKASRHRPRNYSSAFRGRKTIKSLASKATGRTDLKKGCIYSEQKNLDRQFTPTLGHKI